MPELQWTLHWPRDRSGQADYDRMAPHHVHLTSDEDDASAGRHAQPNATGRFYQGFD
jgi:hypothetical protein